MNQNQEKTSLRDLSYLISNRSRSIDCIGLSGSSAAYFANHISHRSSNPVFLVVPTTKDAERMVADLHFFSTPGGPQIRYFPPYNVSPHRSLSYHSSTAAKRIDVLYRLLNDTLPSIVVTTVGALMQRVIPKRALVEYSELLISGEDVDRDLLIEKLVAGGYVRSTMVEEPGDFSIRGGILDVFPPLYQHPVRIEFFGDTVDAIRSFSAVNQRRLHSLQEVVILPAKEAILRNEHIAQIVGRLREQASRQEMPVSETRKLVNRIKNEGVFPGVEHFLPAIYTQLDTLIDYAPSHGLFCLVGPRELEDAAEQVWDQAFEHCEAAKNGGRLCMEPDSLYMRWSATIRALEPRKPVTLNMVPISKRDAGDHQAPIRCVFSVYDNTGVTLEIKRYQEEGKLLLPLADWIKDMIQLGYGTVLVCSTQSQADRLNGMLSPYDIHPKYAENMGEIGHRSGQVIMCIGQISSGFSWPTESLAVITEDEIFGRKHHRRRLSPSEAPSGLLTFEDLQSDDYVVHVEQGIGRYKGLSKLRLDGSTNDFLLIVYKGGDKLYLPVDRMSMVQKYIGVDGVEPAIDKLGGPSWDRLKKKIKKSAEKIAGELLSLYAARKVEKGYPFQQEESDFRDFEAGFAYDETEDQLKAIDAVLHDMKQATSMDRLICGDVGYGKTEVALRAAFVAVHNGKQVAVLVPTTVLAEQHHATFSSRFERYPVHIACLNRFRSAARQRQIIADLASGTIDIVIGTHRLLQKDISFKDLGLVILDEEQRFGVKDKEKLKKLRRTVDVLALTATPIPRTLHMSLLGVRDISIISTPPEHRQAIITTISEFDEALIAEAIQNELDRGGQIFFLHNSIHSIGAMSRRLQQLVPRVRLGVAHGRLKERALERVMLRFVNREIDMLVCTTIIESGLDIPAANTILVNRADRFGLAQMYQLRGRVGRAAEQAYAYLLIPRGAKIGRDAQKRMKVLMEHSNLGSGFQIAMSDLKIRGGGTILGGEQSGHIAAVGYDMFLKLMAESIADLKGEPIREPLEPEINVMMSAFIPESYISDIDQRMVAYRRLARMVTLEEIADFKGEIVDRFGPLPEEATSLLLKIMLKVLSIKAGVKRLDLAGGQLMLYFSEAHLTNPFGILDMIANENGAFEFTPDHVFKAKLNAGNRDRLFEQTKKILKEIAQRVSC